MKTESLSNLDNAQELEEKEPLLADCVKQGDQHASENNWAEAVKFYKQATELDPSDNSILGKLGFCYSRNRQHEMAIEVLSELHERKPQMARWPYMIGYQYYDKKDYDQAVQYFDKALSLKDDYIKALYRDGYARLQIGDSNVAEQLWLKCIACWQKLDDERKLIEKSRYADTCFQMGKLYLSQGLTRKAEKWLKEAVNQDNDDEHKHYNLGKAFLGNGKIPEALEEFRQANTLHPYLDYFQDKLAYACLLAGNADEAEQIYQAIPPHKRKSYIWCNYGRVLLQIGKHDEAVKALLNAARQDYQNHHIHFHLGSAYLETGNIALAVKELELAAGLKLKKFSSEYKEALEKLQTIHSQFGEDIVVVSSDSGTQTHVGRIESYNVNRGFGFLKSESGEKVFFHVSDVINPENISTGHQAEFLRVESDKGPKATKMTVIQ